MRRWSAILDSTNVQDFLTETIFPPDLRWRETRPGQTGGGEGKGMARQWNHAGGP